MALKTYNKAILIFFVLNIHAGCCNVSQSQQPRITIKQINDLTQEITCTFHLTKKDFIYKDFIHFSVAHPQVKLSDWKASITPIAYYDPLFKNTKQVFKNKFSLSLTATTENYCDEIAHLYCTYYQRSEKKIKQIQQPLYFITTQKTIENDSLLATHLEINNVHAKKKSTGSASPLENYIIRACSSVNSFMKSLSMTHDIHIFLLALIFLLCIIPPYFFTKKLHFSIQLTELITITTATSCFLIIGYIIYYIQMRCTPYFIAPLTTLCIFSMGVFYIKKSTKCQWDYLRTLCNLMGTALVATSVLLLFKTIQIISVVF